MKEIIKVEPIEDYKLLITFGNGEKRLKDMKPYLEKGIFKKLKDEKYFKQVKVLYGTISWDGDIELCADSLYINSKPIK